MDSAAAGRSRAARQPPKVLGLIDDHGRDVPLAEALLERPAQFRGGSSVRHPQMDGGVTADATRSDVVSVADEPLVEGQQRARVVILPTELARLGRGCLERDDRHPAGIVLQVGQRRRQQLLLDPSA